MAKLSSKDASAVSKVNRALGSGRTNRDSVASMVTSQSRTKLVEQVTGVKQFTKAQFLRKFGIPRRRRTNGTAHASERSKT